MKIKHQARISEVPPIVDHEEAQPLYVQEELDDLLLPESYSPPPLLKNRNSVPYVEIPRHSTPKEVRRVLMRVNHKYAYVSEFEVHNSR